MVWLQYGAVDVQDGALVLIDREGVRTHIPVGGLACLLLEPGTRITHAAVALAASVGCLLLWVGEGGVRLYSAGQPGGARSDRLLYQAKLALDDDLRLKVVRAMYRFRFQDEPPARRSIEQLRGIEGVRVRELYKRLAKQHGIDWARRDYDPDNFDDQDPVNKCLPAQAGMIRAPGVTAVVGSTVPRAGGDDPEIGMSQKITASRSPRRRG